VKSQARPVRNSACRPLGDYTIGDNSVILLGPPQVFDSSNIDQFKF